VEKPDVGVLRAEEFQLLAVEYNNFIPADPLKTPPHFGPAWYFTPYYSVLRAVTENFVIVLALVIAAYAALIVFTSRGCLSKIVAVLVAPPVIFLMVGPSFTLFGVIFPIEAKVRGVVLFGLSTLIFFLIPWLDKSLVKSIRYKGALSRWALALFVLAFLLLGYYGTQPVTDLGTLISQMCTLIYFAFFLLMPWYSRMEQTRPVPRRVTM
jgi:ubiquinol-cytochrome c reductase cytochrome b subunit